MKPLTKEEMQIADSLRRYNAQTVYDKWIKEWKRVKCLFNNGLADADEVIEVWFSGVEAADRLGVGEQFKEIRQAHDKDWRI